MEVVKGAQVPGETDNVTSINLAARVLNAGRRTQTAHNTPRRYLDRSLLPDADIDIVNEDPLSHSLIGERAAMVRMRKGDARWNVGAGDGRQQPTLSAKQTEAIKAFWSEYFNRAKASLTFHSDVIDGPALTSSDILLRHGR